MAPGLVHRTGAGAVATGLRGAGAVARAARAMGDRVPDVEGFLVQEMAPPGVEMLAGVATDPTFGPVVACAAGGTTAELLYDMAFRLTPLGERDAADRVRSLRTFALLDGFRGAPVCDVAALERVLVALSAVAEAHHEVAELECNPLIVSPAGAVAVDVRIRVEPAPARRPEPSLRGPA